MTAIDFTFVVDYAKKVKQHWVENDDRGDVPPVVIVERKGEVIATVAAPVLDKRYGLHAAELCRRAMDPDHLMLVLDAHFAVPEPDQADDFLKNYTPGSMQRMCDEEGACSAGLISDCLNCVIVNRDGNCAMRVLPYDYHGKQAGVPFKWTTEGKFAEHAKKVETSQNADGWHYEGTIPEALRDIMKLPLLIDDPTFLAGIDLGEVGAKMGFDRERTIYHISRTIFKILQGHGYTVKDELTPKYEAKYSG